ncbi:LysR family transcriptional regulator [Rhizobiales bacterium]|uniref:LysR family transcriptional regulator n=1 Tax=Hongsoonwoonella zoysiae TaxID=2821844 RepID=UPI0015612B1E|nr:LysR family transcriptional regulator [Hongsoonwoonella zoysiae]NRG18146.1 LysR family transcriptional regulator [Hongsoonwoonella zoysiae]
MGWEGLPSLSILRAFEAAARQKSFSAAGRELNVTHVAVAQQVRRLEEHLGVSLIYREGRGIALTEQGEKLSAALSEGLQTIRSGVEEILDTDRDRPLHVSLTPSFAVSWLMPRIGAFRAENPDIELMLNPSPQVVDLKRDGFDLAIRFGSGKWPGMDAEMFLKSNYVLVAAPSVIAGKKIEQPADLAALPWLQELGTEEFAAWMRAKGVEAGSKRDIAHLPGHMILSAVREGQGVAYTSRLFVDDDIREGRLVLLFEEGKGEDAVGYFLVRRPGPMREPLKLFYAWLKRQAKAGDIVPGI